MDTESLAFIAILFIGTSILLIVISIPMILRRVKPNRWYGARTRKTLADERVWYDVNERAGKGLLISGIILLIASVGLALIPDISIDLYTGLVSIIAIAAILVPMVIVLRSIE